MNSMAAMKWFNFINLFFPKTEFDDKRICLLCVQCNETFGVFKYYPILSDGQEMQNRETIENLQNHLKECHQYVMHKELEDRIRNTIKYS